MSRIAPSGKLALAGLTVLVFGLGGPSLIQSLDNFCLKTRWSTQTVLENRSTRYGNLVVTRTEDQVNFYENGLLLFSFPNQYAAEENVHPVMLQHLKPQDILILGGAMAGN